MIPGFIDTSHTTCRDMFADLVSSSNWRFAFNMVQRFTSSNLGILVDFIHISSIPTCNYTVNTNAFIPTGLLKSRIRAEAEPLHVSLLQFLRLLPCLWQGKRRRNCKKPLGRRRRLCSQETFEKPC